MPVGLKLRIVELRIVTATFDTFTAVAPHSINALLISEPAELAVSKMPDQLPFVGEAAFEVSVTGEPLVPAIFSVPFTVSEAPFANFSVVPGCKTSFAPAP